MSRNLRITLITLLAATLMFVAGIWGWTKFSRRFAPISKNPTLLMVFNGEYVSEAENSLASKKKNTPELVDNLTICVSDDSARNFAQKHNLRYFELSTINDTGSYLSVPMNIMGRRKIECVLHLLERGEDVFYFDTDIVFMNNPLSEFNANYDINLQADECSRPYKNKYLCTGFMHLKPNERTISFLYEIIDEVMNTGYKINDQNALDNLVKNKSLMSWYNMNGPSINVLDVCKFPNGCRYFDKSDRFCKPEQALIIHNNHIVGIKNKRARFEKYGLIFSNENSIAAQ